MINQYVGAMITSNIITLCGGVILYGLYNLAGDYLTTFFFMIIFAIALATIRSSVVSSIDKLYQENEVRWKSRKMYMLHQAKFGITFNLILQIISCIRHPTTIFNQIAAFIKTTSIPYLFVLYVIIIKLQCFPQVLLWDVIFWAGIDLIRLIAYPFRKQSANDAKGMLDWIKTSKLFNQLLFASVLLGMILIIPIAVTLIYSDIITYKEDLIPKLQKYQIPQEYKEYVSAEFLLSQLQGQYLSETTIQQLQSYFNDTTIAQNQGVNLQFLEIFYGEHANKISEGLQQCESSLYCKAQLIASNYDLFNDQFYEYAQYGVNYFNAFLPQIKQFASVIWQFLANVFSGSVSFLVKFILFQQGVMYLLTESSLYDVVNDQQKSSFKGTLIANISKNITGVFVSLFSIFMQHFMLSFIFLDLLNIQLAFIQSFLIGILSLTQIVDPGLTFIFITGIWWLAGFFNENAHEFCMNDGISILLAVLFYFSSGSIYLNTFKKQLGDAYWSALAVILGYISFHWQGLIIGPLLVGGVRTLVEVLKWYMGGHEEINKPAEKQENLAAVAPDMKAGKKKRH